MTTSQRALAPSIPTWAFTWRLIRYRPWPFVFHSLCVIVLYTARVAPGLIEKSIFDSISGAAPAVLGPWRCLPSTSRSNCAADVELRPDLGDVTFRIRRARCCGATCSPASCAIETTTPYRVGRRGRQPLRHDVDETCDFPTWLPFMAGEGLSRSCGCDHGQHRPDNHPGHLRAIARVAVVGRMHGAVCWSTPRRNGWPPAPSADSWARSSAPHRQSRWPALS